MQNDNFEAGILRLDAQEKDTQTPHQNDEVYFIVKGDGKIQINGNDFEFKPGYCIFVPKYTSHKFHSNTLEIIAFSILIR
ncbi:MAG: cupin domain-containing protein [Candidatus Kariarchaeaceae archaeon]